MSSGRFETELRPDERLRRLVLASGALSLVTGSVIILHLPLSPFLRLAGLVLWVWHLARELGRQARGAGRVRRLRLASDGNITARGRGRGAPESLTVLSGSVVLERLAWLRLGFADGSHYGELLAGDPGSDPQWHRLQLIWRQRRGAFGRTR